MTESGPTLIAAWQPPETVRENDLVLSFLPPCDEAALARRFPDRILSARRLAGEVRARALDELARICGAIGVSTDRHGRTFRSALQRGDACSDWWFHPLASRSWAAGPSVFESILALLTIDRCATARRLRVVETCGAPAPVLDALRSRYHVARSVATQPAPGLARAWRSGLTSRWQLLTTTLRAIRQIARDSARHGARHGARPATLSGATDDIARGTPKPLIALTGAWNLWLRWNESAGTLVDSHFRGLPASLDRHGTSVVRYVWLPPSPPGQRAESWRRPSELGQVVPLQQFVTGRDVMREAASCGSLTTYLAWTRRPSFRAAFRLDGFDVYPLFRFALAHGFAGAQIPSCRLTALATARATLALTPAATVCHFEQLPSGCAHYEGVRRAGTGAVACTMQHAVNTNGRFYRVDRRRDFLGEPDGCPVPRAANVFMMGDAARKRFEAWGYAAPQLSVSGSTRFDELAAMRTDVRRARSSRPRAGAVRVLLAPTNAGDIELIEAACAAAERVPGIEVLVRQKPGDALAAQPAFRALAPRLKLTTGSLADDLAAADILLITHSSVGDQAFACGVPTWQWVTLGFEGSVLVDLAAVPQFATIEALANALRSFQRDPAAWQPAARDVDRFVRAAFGRADGLDAERIAADLVGLVRDRSTARRERRPTVVPIARQERGGQERGSQERGGHERGDCHVSVH